MVKKGKHKTDDRENQVVWLSVHSGSGLFLGQESETALDRRKKQQQQQQQDPSIQHVGRRGLTRVKSCTGFRVDVVFQERTLTCRSRELEGDGGEDQDSLMSFAEFNHGAVKNKVLLLNFLKVLLQSHQEYNNKMIVPPAPHLCCSVSDGEGSVCSTVDADQWFVWRQSCSYSGPVHVSTQVSHHIHTNYNYTSVLQFFLSHNTYLTLRKSHSAPPNKNEI